MLGGEQVVGVPVVCRCSARTASSFTVHRRVRFLRAPRWPSLRVGTLVSSVRRSWVSSEPMTRSITASVGDQSRAVTNWAYNNYFVTILRNFCQYFWILGEGRPTGVRELTRGLATLPQRWIQEPLVVRDRDGKPPRGPPGSALVLCVAGVYCWEISLGRADPGNVIFCPVDLS